MENFIIRTNKPTNVSCTRISDNKADGTKLIGIAEQTKEFSDSYDECIENVRDDWYTELQEEDEAEIQENKVTEVEKVLVTRSKIRRWATSF